MSVYRGPAQSLPFERHRSVGDIIAACQRGGRNASLVKYGDPAAREEKARELRRRKDALGPGCTNALLAHIAGLYTEHLQSILSGRRRTTWYFLDLVEQAIQREEARREASKGERLYVSQSQPSTVRKGDDAVARSEGAAPRLAAGRAQ